MKVKKANAGTGTITITQFVTAGHEHYRIAGTFPGGGVCWRQTKRGAERVAASMVRWRKRHEDRYVAELGYVLDPGDRMPRGWQAPSDRGGKA